jgi:hypothetical protein
MGYAHCWSRVETTAGPLPPEPRDAYGRVAFDTLTILHAAGRCGVVLADGAATPGSRPVVDEGGIWLNGLPPDHCDAFAWPPEPGAPWWSDLPGHRWWDACSTNRRPYDLVVCSILLRAAAHYGPSVEITSDGVWDKGTLTARRWPGWVPARRLVVELFGPDADQCPFPP